MELLAARSWRLGTSVDELPHLALYVRDALRLPVPDDPALPPPLSHAVPDRSDRLRPEARAEAGAQWASWWHALVELEARRHEASWDRDLLDWGTEYAEGRERVGAWPHFAGLADRLDLREAALATAREPLEWFDRSISPAGREPEGFPWPAVRRVAQVVARRHRVRTGDLRGTALLLDVEGLWWQPLSSGTVLCSLSAAADPIEGERVLWQAFESSLMR